MYCCNFHVLDICRSLLQKFPVFANSSHHSAYTEVAMGTGNSSLLLQHFMKLKWGGGVTGLDCMKKMRRDWYAVSSSFCLHWFWFFFLMGILFFQGILVLICLIKTKCAWKIFWKKQFQSFHLRKLVHHKEIHTQYPAGSTAAFHVYALTLCLSPLACQKQRVNSMNS